MGVAGDEACGCCEGRDLGMVMDGLGGGLLLFLLSSLSEDSTRRKGGRDDADA